MSEKFDNVQIPVNQLPSVQEVEYTGLQPSYLRVSQISNAILWAIFSIPALIFIIVNPFSLPLWAIILEVLLLLALIGLSFILISKGFYKKGYAIRSKDIIYKTGLFWKSSTVVPFNRIQHSEVKQGPVERMFNLSSFHVYTAGGSSSDLSIPGLIPERAESLKEFVLQKIKKEEGGSNEEE